MPKAERFAPLAPPPPPRPAPFARAAAPQTVEAAAFLAGAALAALDVCAREPHPIGTLWRQRLALRAASASLGLEGRDADETALRDAVYLRRPGDDPGPAGRSLLAFRALAGPDAFDPARWIGAIAPGFGLKPDPALERVAAQAEAAMNGAAGAIAAAAQSAARALENRPDAPGFALWLADAVVARRLRWPAAAPLLATQIRRAELRAAGRTDDEWLRLCHLGYARAALAAADLYADLIRRAEKLLGAAPLLRGKDAAAAVETLLREDALAPAASARRASDRSGRRLCERLVALGAARELTGRASFRLYGL